MEIKIVELSASSVAELLAGLCSIASAPKSDADLLSEAASQIITIANRLEQQPAHEELEWYAEDLPERMSWTAAKEAVDKLGEGWRLPTDKEWEAEIDRAKFDPALRDAEKFPGIKSDDSYWTGTPGASDPQDYAWVVGLHSGYVHLYCQNAKFWVRPCRARRAASQ